MPVRTTAAYHEQELEGLRTASVQYRRRSRLLEKCSAAAAALICRVVFAWLPAVAPFNAVLHPFVVWVFHESL